jgi:hypothetical protein
MGATASYFGASMNQSELYRAYFESVDLIKQLTRSLEAADSLLFFMQLIRLIDQENARRDQLMDLIKESK